MARRASVLATLALVGSVNAAVARAITLDAALQSAAPASASTQATSPAHTGYDASDSAGAPSGDPAHTGFDAPDRAGAPTGYDAVHTTLVVAPTPSAPALLPTGYDVPETAGVAGYDSGLGQGAAVGSGYDSLVPTATPGAAGPLLGHVPPGCDAVLSGEAVVVSPYELLGVEGSSAAPAQADPSAVAVAPAPCGYDGLDVPPPHPPGTYSVLPTAGGGGSGGSSSQAPAATVPPSVTTVSPPAPPLIRVSSVAKPGPTAASAAAVEPPPRPWNEQFQRLRERQPTSVADEVVRAGEMSDLVCIPCSTFTCLWIAARACNQPCAHNGVERLVCRVLSLRKPPPLPPSWPHRSGSLRRPQRQRPASSSMRCSCQRTSPVPSGPPRAWVASLAGKSFCTRAYFSS
jgi:hypothetical protein